MSRKQRVDALPDIDKRRVPKSWYKMMAVKESRHGESKWKKNPIKVVDVPAAITVFRQLDKGLRHKMLNKLSTPVSFDPKKLVTYQPCVSAAAVLTFARDRKLADSKTAYVVGTELGPCIWNGNHRAAGALIDRREFKALYLDLVGASERRKHKKR